MKHLFIMLFCLNYGFTNSQSTKVEDKVTANQLKEIIKKSNKEFNIIYTYTDWCSPCVKEFPNVIKFCQVNNINLYIIILSKDGNADLQKFKNKFKEKYNFEGYLFNYSFGEIIVKTVKKSNYKNFQGFIKELINEKYESEIIYGSDNLILFNKNADIIYISKFLTYEKIYADINKFIR